METTFAPNNLRISLLRLIRNIPEKCFHWKNAVKYNWKAGEIQWRGKPKALVWKGLLNTQGSLPRGPSAFHFQAALLCNDVPLPASWRDQGALAKQHVQGWPVLLGILISPAERGPSSALPWGDSWHFLSPQHLCCCCLLAKSCLTLCDPMDCSPPGSPVHGILQAWTHRDPTQGLNPPLLLWQVDSLLLSHQVSLTISGALMIIMRCRP